MRNISTMPGVQPELRQYLDGLEGALNGDIVMDVSPATLGSGTTVETRVVNVTIKDAAGDTLEWVNTTIASKISKTDVTEGNGTSAISASTLTLVNGVGTVTVTYSDTWAADDTQTVTIASIVLAGVTVTGGTSADTIV